MRDDTTRTSVLRALEATRRTARQVRPGTPRYLRLRALGEALEAAADALANEGLGAPGGGEAEAFGVV